MKEISHSIFYEPEGFLARVPGDSGDSDYSFHDRQGLESLIFTMRAHAEDTVNLEDQLDVLVSAESFFIENNRSIRNP